MLVLLLAALRLGVPPPQVQLPALAEPVQPEVAIELNASVFQPLITPGNPFFNEVGQPLIVFPSNDLIDKLNATGCKWAWRRRWHQVQKLDQMCNDIVTPFVLSAPGASLGLLVKMMTNGLINKMDNVFNGEEIIMPTSKRFLSMGQDGYSFLDPLKLGFQPGTIAPQTLVPIPGFTTEELEQLALYGGNGEPYVFHAAGNWTMQYLLRGRVDHSEEEMLQAGEYCSQLWMVLGTSSGGCEAVTCEEYDNAIMNLGLDDFGMDLLVHGVHGATMIFTSIMAESSGISKYQQPSTTLFDAVERFCNRSWSLNFKPAWILCIHGVGHSLTYYVSSNTSSVPEAIAICSALKDPRLVNECQEGFFHELERANIWTNPLFKQAFVPWGTNAPCDYADLPGFALSHAACFREVTKTGKPQFPIHRVVPNDWISIEDIFIDLGVQHVIVTFTAIGHKGWGGILNLCYGTPFYSDDQVARAACLSTHVSWLRSGIDERVMATNLTGKFRVYWSGNATVDIAISPLSHHHDELAAGVIRVPTLKPFKRHEDFSDALFENWDVAVCEASVRKLPSHWAFYAWAACVHQVDFKAPGVLDPWALPADGTAEALVGGVCTERFGWANFESGTERQLSLLEKICMESSISHTYAYTPLVESPEKFVKKYSAQAFGPYGWDPDGEGT